MEDFDLRGNNYRIAKLGLLEQAGVGRRVLPIIGGLAPMLRQLGALARSIQEATPDNPGPDIPQEVLDKVMDELVTLKDEDVNYVLSKCLSCAQRQQGAGWVRVWNNNANSLQFEDMDCRMR
jgi:hypothetical protein